MRDHGAGPARSAASWRWGMPYSWMGNRVGHRRPAIHVAFTAESREKVDAFHAARSMPARTDNGGPGMREIYHPNYYGAFVWTRRQQLEAVCHTPAEDAPPRRYAPAPMPERFTVLLMAAGRGTRMRSSLPKVLHPVCGRPMVEWVIEAARAAGAGEVVCITRPGDGVADGLPDTVTVAEQREGEGTGAAILAARGQASDSGTTRRPVGRSPAGLQGADREPGRDPRRARAPPPRCSPPRSSTRPATGGSCAPTTARWTGSWRPSTPTALSEDELAIREINIGAYAFEAADLWPALEQVGEERGELYLTGVFPALREKRQAGRHPRDHRCPQRHGREQPRRPDGVSRRWPSARSSSATRTPA